MNADSVRVLHVLDHSIPAHSGYSFRTRSILTHQRARGWETHHVTSTKHPNPVGAVVHVIISAKLAASTKRPLAANRAVVMKVPLVVVDSFGWFAWALGQPLRRILSYITAIHLHRFGHTPTPFRPYSAVCRSGWACVESPVVTL